MTLQTWSFKDWPSTYKYLLDNNFEYYVLIKKLEIHLYGFTDPGIEVDTSARVHEGNRYTLANTPKNILTIIKMDKMCWVGDKIKLT